MLTDERHRLAQEDDATEGFVMANMINVIYKAGEGADREAVEQDLVSLLLEERVTRDRERLHVGPRGGDALGASLKARDRGRLAAIGEVVEAATRRARS